MENRPLPATGSPPAVLERYFGLSEAEIAHQIDEHKYFLNLEVPHEISRAEALESWARNVFEPLMRALETQGLGQDFPDLGVDELFLRVSAHWYFLKRDHDAHTTADHAAISYGARFAPNELSRAGYWARL